VADELGFAYLDAGGAPITGQEALARIRALAIPPAWRDVWISPDPLGHLQAVGVDAAGRHQYLYHELWREHEDRLKFEHMERFARTLPGMRESLLATMAGRRELDRARVLACAIRLLDVGLFRIGSDVYEKEDGHLGLSTLARSNVTIAADGVVFDYVAKEGVRQVHTVRDPPCVEIVSALKRRHGGGVHLLAFREARVWHAIHAHLINEHLKHLIGASFSAKNFRTWNGTLLAAVSVARHGGEADTEQARRRVIARAANEVAQALGNTPAVARSSYIDPRVFDRYRAGLTIAGELARIDARLNEEEQRAQVDRAVLDLLAST
jgi:DNA topoisomerase IB